MVTYDDLSPVFDRLVLNDRVIAAVAGGAVLYAILSTFQLDNRSVEHVHVLPPEYVAKGRTGKSYDGSHLEEPYLSGIGGWY